MAELEQRIEAMYRRDRMAAWVLVAALWVVILFVLVMTWPLIPVPAIRWVVLAAAAVVLVFNTAAIRAMVSHYSEDKHFIYALDIQHFDEARAARRKP